ncbi:hypothetical protein DM860_014278 [Cuscuta australis]|uniref:Uncharacterized protein n=1 Tax=Cuscuta australis TaxID=267555 RepID=A0A328DDJ4_9ASTE|nr:hypothetical protein DM860_014278 [Cuscuta australis]
MINSLTYFPSCLLFEVSRNAWPPIPCVYTLPKKSDGIKWGCLVCFNAKKVMNSMIPKNLNLTFFSQQRISTLCRQKLQSLLKEEFLLAMLCTMISKDGRSRALKSLAAEILGACIQQGEHCPVEDARAAMFLYLKHRKRWEKHVKDFTRMKKKQGTRKPKKQRGVDEDQRAPE